MKICLGAAPGLMRSVPRRVTATLTIEVTDHCTPLTATGPVVTGMVSVIREERRAVGHRAGKHVMSVLRVTAAQHPITILVQGGAPNDVRA